MKVTVNEPAAEYRTKQWPTTESLANKLRPATFVDDGVGIYIQPTMFNIKKSRYNKPKRIKISSLRGKFTKQTKEEIDKQLRELRNEWDRGF